MPINPSTHGGVLCFELLHLLVCCRRQFPWCRRQEDTSQAFLKSSNRWIFKCSSTAAAHWPFNSAPTACCTQMMSTPSGWNKWYDTRKQTKKTQANISKQWIIPGWNPKTYSLNLISTCDRLQVSFRVWVTGSLSPLLFDGGADRLLKRRGHRGVIGQRDQKVRDD